MRVLVTGGAGFIGSHFVRRLVDGGDSVVVLDKLTYAGNPANLEGVEHEFVLGDIADPAAVATATAGCDAIVNFAAETHVDRSILGPTEFVHTDVLGTMCLLEAARDLGANGFTSVMRVFVPGVSRGLLTAMALVLIPALGSYVIPDLVGGPNDEMIGNKIAQRTLGDRNLPQAATLSVALLVITMIPMIVVFVLNRRERAANG